MDPKEQIGKFREVYNSLREEIGKVIVGQDAIGLSMRFLPMAMCFLRAFLD